MRCLDSEVLLLLDYPCEFLHNFHRMYMLQFLQMFLGERGYVEHYLQIHLYDSVNLRALNLDCYFFTIGQHRFVDLCNRSSGDGCIRKVLENAVHGLTQFLFDNPLAIFRRKRRYGILESFQLGDKFLWDHVRSGAHNLTEFDESRPKFLQSHSHPFPMRKSSYFRGSFPQYKALPEFEMLL